MAFDEDGQVWWLLALFIAFIQISISILFV
jgi:hypothetical protein